MVWGTLSPIKWPNSRLEATPSCHYGHSASGCLSAVVRLEDEGGSSHGCTAESALSMYLWDALDNVREEEVQAPVYHRHPKI